MYYQYTVQNPKLFTLPIALSGIIQQLFNAADTSIVGYFDNAAAGALLILLPTGPQYMAATSVGLFFTGLLSGIHIGCTIVGVFVLFCGLSLFLRGRG